MYLDYVAHTGGPTLDATLADASIVTAATVPDEKSGNYFPDLLLCHTHATGLDKPDAEDKVFGWERRMQLKVIHHCFPGIMEIKGCPSRSLRGSKLTTP